jgi:hypothetical protein
MYTVLGDLPATRRRRLCGGSSGGAPTCSDLVLAGELSAHAAMFEAGAASRQLRDAHNPIVAVLQE